MGRTWRSLRFDQLSCVHEVRSPRSLTEEQHSPPCCGKHTLAIYSRVHLTPCRCSLDGCRSQVLHVLDAVMGASLSQAEVDASNKVSRQELSRGEIGILRSNRLARANLLLRVLRRRTCRMLRPRGPVHSDEWLCASSSVSRAPAGWLGGKRCRLGWSGCSS